MLTALVEGKDADLWFLVALILFVVAAVICVTDKAWVMALTTAGLAFVALGWLVL
jgi:hypothetical protein